MIQRYDCRREPLDLRLLILRLLKKAGVIITITFLGTLLMGGGYYIKNVLLGEEASYGVRSLYKVEYATDPNTEIAFTYINAATWNDWVRTDEFVEDVLSALPFEVKAEELEGYLSADLPSDLRMPTTLVVTPEQEMSLAIAKAVEDSFVKLASGQREIERVEVVTHGDSAEKILPQVHLARGVAVSAVVSCLAAVLFFLLKELGEDSIWLPVQMRRRYGVKTVGTVEGAEFAQNLHYFFEKCRKVGVCPLQENVDIREVVEAVQRAVCAQSEMEHVAQEMQQVSDWVGFPALYLCPESCRKLRELDGILLVVTAGAHAARKLEAALDFLEQQDCPVTAVLLWQADEKLIRSYYRFHKERV